MMVTAGILEDMGKYAYAEKLLKEALDVYKSLSLDEGHKPNMDVYDTLSRVAKKAQNDTTEKCMETKGDVDQLLEAFDT